MCLHLLALPGYVLKWAVVWDFFSKLQISYVQIFSSLLINKTSDMLVVLWTSGWGDCPVWIRTFFFFKITWSVLWWWFLFTNELYSQNPVDPVKLSVEKKIFLIHFKCDILFALSQEDTDFSRGRKGKTGTTWRFMLFTLKTHSSTFSSSCCNKTNNPQPHYSSEIKLKSIWLLTKG